MHYKNDSGGLTGEWGAGVFATSKDCIHWDLHPNPCPTRSVTWDDGTTSVIAKDSCFSVGVHFCFGVMGRSLSSLTRVLYQIQPASQEGRLYLFKGF